MSVSERQDALVELRGDRASLSAVGSLVSSRVLDLHHVAISGFPEADLARMEDHSECMLVLIGATPEGRKELIGFQVGVRESSQSWRELLLDIKQRGLRIAPEIAVGNGALGVWKALDENFPGTRPQRCWLHKTVNVLDKVPPSVQANMKTDLREIS